MLEALGPTVQLQLFYKQHGLAGVTLKTSVGMFRHATQKPIHTSCSSTVEGYRVFSLQASFKATVEASRHALGPANGAQEEIPVKRGIVRCCCQ